MPTPSLTIRDFREEDFESLYRLDQICFEAGIAYSCAELAYYLSRRRCIARIAEISGIVAGFILALDERSGIAHMITLDVHPGHRRTGVGMALMQDMHAEFQRRGITTSFLEVAVGNDSAQTLYQKLGYRRIETLVGYYRGKEDAHRLAAAIPAFGR